MFFYVSVFIIILLEYTNKLAFKVMKYEIKEHRLGFSKF